MTPLSNPLVSICIPCYNGADHIRYAVDSALNQTYSNIEIIISDDCSTDLTYSILNEYQDDRIKITRNQANYGFAGNWNHVVSLASGEYIKLLPQDDVISDDCIAKQLDALQSHGKKTAFVFSSRNILSPTGKVLFSRGRNFLPEKMYIDQSEIIKKIVRSGGNPIGEPGAVLMDKSAMYRAGLFDGSHHYIIDINYWVRLLGVGGCIFINENLASFRVNLKSESVRLVKKQFLETAFLIDFIYNGFPDISRLDVLIGKSHAIINNSARYLIYKVLRIFEN